MPSLALHLVSQPSVEPHPSVSINAVEVRFPTGKRGSFLALGPVDLSLGPNSFVSLVGPSGCGKSTLLRVISGLIHPSSGHVTIEGNELAAPRTDVNFVFQSASLLPWRTVLDNILLPAIIKKRVDSKMRTRAQSLLDLMNLTEFANSYPHQLSGGMQQRAAIARGILMQPSILLMDEPFSALDEFTREYLNEELLRIWRREQMSVVFVTHSIAEAVFLSQKVVIMSPNPGRISHIINIDLPNPRSAETRTSPQFFNYTKQIRQILFSSLSDTMSPSANRTP